MVAGFPLPDYDRNHTQPPGLAEQLPPLLDFADRIGKLSDRELADRCLDLIEQQREIVMRWLREGRHEVMVVVFQSTDFAQHRLWKYLDQPGHPLREALLEMYRGIDAMVGEARELMGEEGAVAVVSDHGFGPHPRTFVRTDRLLADAGFLSAGGEAGRGEHVTRALRRAPALRRVLRGTLGRLPAGARDRVAARATGVSRVDWTRSQRLSDPALPARRGHRDQSARPPGAGRRRARRRVRAGARPRHRSARRPARSRHRRAGGAVGEAARAAVLGCAPGRGSGHRGPVSTPPTRAPRGWASCSSRCPSRSSTATRACTPWRGSSPSPAHGVPPGVDLGERSIVDVAPTLLALLGRPVPSDSDGAVMAEALRDGVAVHEGAGSYQERAAGGEAALSAEEEATLERSLRALGYLE